jgi:hypothetical protein
LITKGGIDHCKIVLFSAPCLGLFPKGVFAALAFGVLFAFGGRSL